MDQLEVNESFIERLERVYGKDNIKLSFCYGKLSRLLKEGWKFCTLDHLLIKTDDPICPECGKKMRANTRTGKSV